MKARSLLYVLTVVLVLVWGTACGEAGTPPAHTPTPVAAQYPTQTPTTVPTATPAPTLEVVVATATHTPVPPTATPPPTVTPAPDTPTPQPTPTPAIEGRAAVSVPEGVAFRGHAGEVTQEGGGEGAARQTNVAFILDASGSMNADLPGSGQSRLAVAKQVMADLIPQVPPEVRGALWIYGHRYPQEPKETSCTDIEQIYPLGPVDREGYIQAIQAVTAIGYTPISDALEQAARDLVPGDVNSIVLVSDGEETCGGDPCALAEALKASDSEITVHVVGYAVDKVTREQLQCIARVSGGTYQDAEDEGGLLDALEEALAASVAETILRVEVLGPDGIEQAVSARLYRPGTDQLLSGYQSWTDNAVPPGTYDLVIRTLPWIAYPGLAIPERSTTIVRIELGAIRPLTPEGQETTVAVYQAVHNERLGGYGGTILLVPDTYRLMLNQSWSAPIAVQSGETQEYVLGAVRVLSPEGEVVHVVFWEDADPARRLGGYGGTVLLMPGRYVLDANNSYSEPISVDPGETVEYVTGAIRVLSPEGKEISVVFWEDADPDRRLGGYGGTVLLMPGAYVLDASNSYSAPIAVAAGETVEYVTGAIQVDGHFVLFDDTGRRLGGYDGTLPLMPGTYTVEIDGRKVEDVVVESGQVTAVK